MVNVADLAITSLETITAFDVVTDAYKFTLDELQSATIAQSQDETEITGKQGRRLASLKRNKSITISGTNGLLSAGLLEAQTGSDFEHKTTPVMWYDNLTVQNNKATTSHKAIGTAGKEIVELYVKNSDGTLGVEKTQDASASAGKFAYDPSTKEITFADGDVENGKEIYVAYRRNITADVLVNDSDKYSAKLHLYIDAIAEDRCANVYRVQIDIPKADFNGEFSFEMGDNQTVHEFEATSLAGACGGAATLFTYTVFGANAEDAE